MSAGVDQDMPGASFMNADRLVAEGALANATLDRAVGNILTKKFAARLFDNPGVDPAMASNKRFLLKRITMPEMKGHPTLIQGVGAPTQRCPLEPVATTHPPTHPPSYLY